MEAKKWDRKYMQEHTQTAKRTEQIATAEYGYVVCQRESIEKFLI